MSIYRNPLKRSVNVCVAAVGALLPAPALLTLAIAMKTRRESPVFFGQTRPGLRGRPFRMVKLRTAQRRPSRIPLRRRHVDSRAFLGTGSGLNTYGVATLLYPAVVPAHHLREAHNDYLQLVIEGALLVGVPMLIAIAGFRHGRAAASRGAQRLGVPGVARRRRRHRRRRGAVGRRLQLADAWQRGFVRDALWRRPSRGALSTRVR